MLLLLIIGVSAVNITQFSADSAVYSPQFCLIRNSNREGKEWLETIFTLSEKGRIYKSVDNGYKWSDETSILEKMGINDWFYEMQISPANKEVIYVFGKNGTGIRSEDCGQHYTWFTFPINLTDFKLNSMDDEWMLAYSNCERCHPPFNKDIHKSNDGGKTWKWILSSAMMASWDKLIDSELIPDERIVACHLENNQSRVTYSDDYYNSYKIIHNNGTGFFQTQFHMFVISKLSSTYKLHVAPAFYDYAQMINISIPFDEQYSYTLLDTESEQIFLSVSHNQTNKKLTNIYTSDFQGFKFTISLLNNVRSLNTGQCDFERIESLRGVYIANIYDHEKLNVVKQEVDLEKYKKTVITFDKGAIWHPLRAPDKDANGQKIHCSGDCSLHLQGRSVSKIYRESKAVGLIMASGNVGLYLEEKNINTYFSRDGGLTWYEIRKGHHIYSFGDRGGIIVMAKAKSLTNELLYSWDEGLNWETLVIPKMIVTSITSRSLYINFIITGIDEKRQGIILNVDFTTLHQRTCSGIWDPLDPDSDYEFWIPKNYVNHQCLFGQKYRYTRRKRNAQCFNQQEHDKIHYIDSCECTIEDWECDYGFYRKVDGGPCVPIASLFEEDEYIDILKPPENCTGTYMKSLGYRKIVGDYCTGGVNLDPIETPCEEGLQQSLSNQTQSLPQLSIKEEQKKLNEEIKDNSVNVIGQKKNNLSIGWLLIILICLFVFAAWKKIKANQNEELKKDYYSNFDRVERMNLREDDYDGI
ncbi:unnamed protein product [Paramecium sonneborni]|uniref:VPS10 domain-containing protein n=1 Tax=Paramecium sonneborni TaxID=65129 RepID=A0A8S1RHE9_9CILI|nr:unnamed protein product [Paramecium sonneborni]